ncbi:hypothetical protein [Enterococcus sp. DIV0421]|uniref:hypothetical protein n=1 Tax=Enterococcus sp. DIV0421 TaxID=2774688 RepID=UPI003F6855D7
MIEGNAGVKHNVEFWMRIKGESEALKEIINKIELSDTNAVDASKPMKGKRILLLKKQVALFK